MADFINLTSLTARLKAMGHEVNEEDVKQLLSNMEIGDEEEEEQLPSLQQQDGAHNWSLNSDTLEELLSERTLSSGDSSLR